jgi:hypothetical protein
MPSLLTLDWPPELMVKLATEAAGLTYDIQVSSSTVDLDNPSVTAT